MCGIAGSGKTTFSKELEKFNFISLSIDEGIWTSHGKYGFDFPESQYQLLQFQAEDKLFIKFVELLDEKRNTVVDFSFWQKEKRKTYKKIIEKFGGKHFLIFMNPSIQTIKDRLKIRNQKLEANAAFPITEELIDNYFKSFEIPTNESEIVINN